MATAVLVIMLIAIAGVAGALLLQDSADDPGGAENAGRSDSPGSTPTSEPPPELDADGNQRLDSPGPPPGHVEPAPASAAPEVESLNHGLHDGFERVSITFTGDLPPTAELHRDPDRGLLRVAFPDVDPTGGVDGDAVTRVFANSELGLSAFLVIDERGDAFVDIHAHSPVVAESFRLITEAGSAVVAVDIEADPDGVWAPSPVDPTGGVILEPVLESHVVGPTHLYVEGYGRRDEGGASFELIDSSGTVVDTWSVDVPAGGLANGLFGYPRELPGPLVPGPYRIRFGGNAPDGSPAAVETTVIVD